MAEDRRFITSPPVEDVLAEFMTPVMAQAGFKQRKKQYQIKGENGAFVRVQVRPWGAHNDFVSFGILWSAIPPVLAEFLGRDKKIAWPAYYHGLFVQTVEAPLSVRTQPEAKSDWECRFAEYGRFGEVFTSSLRSDLIPTWIAALDPAYLLSTGIGTDCAFPFGYPPLRELFLTIDSGDRGRVEALLREASVKQLPDPDLLPWLQARVQERS